MAIRTKWAMLLWGLHSPAGRGREQAKRKNLFLLNIPMREKLEVVRIKFPAITHVDLSCRIQTVTRESNFLFWQLLNAFESLTGEAMLINTSFNVRGEPIVCNPEEAYSCFMNTEMDMLVINNFVFLKSDQSVRANSGETYAIRTD